MTQLPLQTQVTHDEILEFISPCLSEIVQRLSSFIEGLSSEVQADLKQGNVYFVGGGQLIYTFAKQIEKGLNLTLTIPDNPLDAVARGAIIIAEHPDQYKKYFLNT